MYPEIHIRLHTKENCTETERLIHQLTTHLQDICFTQDPEETLASRIIALSTQANLTIALAESCTGGRIAAQLTEVSGASQVFLTGVVTYSNESKSEWLGVSSELIETQGAVSEAVAKEMAVGIQAKTNASLALSVTGIAGPTGGTEDTPVGIVYVGFATHDECRVIKHECRGSREKIQRMATSIGLQLLYKHLTRKVTA